MAKKDKKDKKYILQVIRGKKTERVFCTETKKIIPNNEGNRDWQDYLMWCVNNKTKAK